MNAILATLAEASLRALAVALLAGVTLAAVRVRASSARHAVWTAVLCAMLAMPWLPAMLPSFRAPVSAPIVIHREPAPSFAPPLRVVADSAPPPMPIEWRRAPVWPEALVILWATVALLLLARFAAGWFAMQRIAGAAVHAHGKLFESAHVAVPVTAGVVAPRILLPLGWREWTRARRRAVLAHEMAHVRRRDTLVSMLAHLNRCLFWFHPLAWWLERRLEVTAEYAADDAAVGQSQTAREYAEMLVEMAGAARRQGGRLAWNGVGVDNGGLVGARIERVLRAGAVPPLSRARKLALAFCCAAVIVVCAACRPQSLAALKRDPDYAAERARNRAEEQFVRAARAMTPHQAAGVEALLVKNSADAAAHKQLLYYYQPRATTPAALASFRQHRFWMLLHHPEDRATRLDPPQPDITGDIAAERLLLRAMATAPKDGQSECLGHLYANALTGPEGQSDFGQRARRQLAESTDAKLLGTVAWYIVRGGCWRDPVNAGTETARAYATRALRFDPEQDTARRALAFIAEIDWTGKLPANLRRSPVERWMEALGATPSAERPRLLARLSTDAYIFGEWADNRGDSAQARNYWTWARRMAKLALASSAGAADAGTAIYQANMTLGMVTLRVDGNARAAARHLVDASKAPPTEALAYNVQAFGTRLPAALLKYGGPDERRAVVEYLERYGEILRRPDLPLRENAAQLRRGLMPGWYEHQAAALN